MKNYTYKEINNSKKGLITYLLSGGTVHYSNWPLQLRNKKTKEVYSRWIRVFTEKERDKFSKDPDRELLIISLEEVFRLSVVTPNCDGVVFDNKAFLKQEIINDVSNEFQRIEERKDDEHDDNINSQDVKINTKKI